MTIEERKEKEKARRRASILRAAEKVFAKEGYHAATMDAVAAAADLSKGTLYLYFNNKQDLFFSLLAEKMDTERQLLQERIQQAHDMPSTLREIVHTQLQFIQRNHRFFRLVVSERAKVGRTFEGKHRQVFLQKQQALIDLVRQALEPYFPNPNPSAITPQTLSLSLLGAVSTHTVHWLLNGATGDLMDQAEGIIQLFQAGLNALSGGGIIK